MLREKKYDDMDEKEKAVVDGINGNGAEGSGKKNYAKVLKTPSYYLSELGSDNTTLPLLTAKI